MDGHTLEFKNLDSKDIITLQDKQCCVYRYANSADLYKNLAPECNSAGHWKQQSPCTEHAQTATSCHSNPLVAAFFPDWSVGECCLILTNIHLRPYQTLLCSLPTRGKSQPSRPVSSEKLSNHLHQFSVQQKQDRLTAVYISLPPPPS